MKIKNKNFLPNPNLSKEGMKRLQIDIGREAIFDDNLDFDPSNIEDLKVAGIDQAFLDDKAISSTVIMQNGKVIEKSNGSASLEIPYIPGLLAFREGEAIVNALEKLETEPDILILDGSGRIHFRQAGIATHIGLMFDKSSIGVAKNLLCGRTAEETDKLEKGERVPIFANKKVNTQEGTLIGYAFQSKQYSNSKRINPLYISSGHRISADTAVEIVEKLCSGYKLPEPTRLADKQVAELKKKMD